MVVCSVVWLVIALVVWCVAVGVTTGCRMPSKKFEVWSAADCGSKVAVSPSALRSNCQHVVQCTGFGNWRVKAVSKRAENNQKNRLIVAVQ